MTSYLIKRILYSLFVLWGAVSIVFIVLRLVPSNPVVMQLGADSTPEQRAALAAEMGLDKPVIVQYWNFLTDAVQLDFGSSYRLQQEALPLVLERLPATLELAGAALIMALMVGIPLGMIAALNVNRVPDRIVSTLSLTGQSLPPFWIGIVLILVFARVFGVLPSGGTGSLLHIVLPAFTLAFPCLAILTRMTRNGLVEVLGEGYIQTARSKGLKERIVIAPHAIRNALIPLVPVVGVQFGILLAGSVVGETVFSWPGIGRMLIDAINMRDYNLVQAAVLVIAIGFVVINLIVDLLYVYLDPRVRITK